MLQKRSTEAEAAFKSKVDTFHRLEGTVVSDVIPDLEIPRGTPVVYELDADLKPIPNEFSSRLMAIPSVPS